MIDILISAFIFSLVLLGIHTYYGLHIIRRGIIFTDLAIGQMAALGASIALLLFDHEYLYPISLLFAFIGAILIALSSKKKISHEAFIGLLYALGFSLSIILLSKSPHGAEEAQKLMASDILFVSSKEIIKITILYLILGAIIIFFVEKTSGFLHDILFFTTFAITVTASVNLAGVFVVFAILVAPPYIISFFSEKFSVRLIGSWLIGILINLIAIVVSYFYDIPTGYTIVAFYTILGVFISLIYGKPLQIGP